MGGRKDIYQDANGFDKNPENINRNGRPKKLISYINTELKNEGYCPASLSEIKEAYLTLINLPLSKIAEIASSKNDDYPMLYKLTAKELTGKRGMEMMKELLDRSVGKPEQKTDITTNGESLHFVELTDAEKQKIIDKL